MCAEQVLKTPQEWMKQLHPDLSIRDPDGWRDSDGPSFDEPISREEFDIRFERCTVGPKRQPTL